MTNNNNNNSNNKNLGGGEGFWLTGCSLSSREARAGIQGRNWSKEHGGQLLLACGTWLYSAIAQGCHWTLLHQSAIKKRPIDVLTGQSDGGDSSTEAHSSQVTPVCQYDKN